MEILLNLLWLAVAFAIGAVFLPRHRGGIAPTVAVACLIALLFPIVSISDDLAPTRDAVEECSGVRRIAAEHSSLQSSIHPAAAVAAAPATASANFLTLIGFIDSARVCERHLILASRTNPRSPPSL